MSRRKENDLNTADAVNESEPIKARKPARRIIIPKKNEPVSTLMVQSTDLLIDDAKLIIAAELARYRQKASRGISLDLKEARVVTGYIAELTKLQREEREQARSEDLSNLTDDELLQVAAQVLGKTKPKLIEE